MIKVSGMTSMLSLNYICKVYGGHYEALNELALKVFSTDCPCGQGHHSSHLLYMMLHLGRHVLVRLLGSRHAT